MGGYGTIQDAKERSQDRRKNLDAMKYDKKSSALSELKAKRQERERRDMERAKKEKEKSKGGKINMLNQKIVSWDFSFINAFCGTSHLSSPKIFFTKFWLLSKLMVWLKVSVLRTGIGWPPAGLGKLFRSGLVK